MLPAVTNRSLDLWQEGNSSTSEKAVSQRPWVFAAAAHSNDSRPEPDLPNVDPPTERTSGIIPGLIAAALFIAFLLGLYAMLWKCMVSQANRRMNMRRVKIRKKPDLAAEEQA